ncbi:GAP family protein [Mycobacterium sp. 236(2023)]|uniref:GAP family protein n=1 Tax=Mycobacterium sp. 236(2023) TaxID=3038163 RepID=UPI00241508E9|nr:GAP family protein [Mycobacterium sp. 236(2023)]MDG4663083.1 GAP family protein [Mycobacterium sp. 236(2023)]
MWFPLLVMAVAVSLEPFRVGMTVVMLNRPRPLLQLLAFLTGGFLMGTAVGVAVLFLLRPALRDTHFNLPKVQIAVGALVIVTAGLVAAGFLGGTADREPGRFETRLRALLTGRSLWTAGVAGLGIALPSIDYLAALALIAASGAAATSQFGALMAFNVVAFALVEIPLLCYVIAPERTRAALTALNNWIRARGRYGVCALMAVIGAVLLAVGFAAL